jgi:hypothetical protein
MPRLPVDGVKVQELRITFGSKERQLLSELVGAEAFNKIATPVVAGMSDVSFMIALGGILTIWFPEIVLPTGAASPEEVVDAVKKGVKAGLERAKAEREATGEATLDESEGVRDFLGRLVYNLTNPNWAPPLSGAPGVTESLRDIWGDITD